MPLVGCIACRAPEKEGLLSNGLVNSTDVSPPIEAVRQLRKVAFGVSNLVNVNHAVQKHQEGDKATFVCAMTLNVCAITVSHMQRCVWVSFVEPLALPAIVSHK